MQGTNTPAPATFQSVLTARDGHFYVPMGELRIEQALPKANLSESYLAYHEGLDQRVEIRVMKHDVSQKLGVWMDEEMMKACRYYARIRHPSITALYDLGVYHGRYYWTSEYTTGIPLNERIKERPLNVDEALKVMTPIGDGLAELWRNDYIHRGVSPFRVIITSTGTPKLDIVILPRVPLDPMVIEAHAPFMAGYWPPEELRASSDIDARSDMFSFGASLYYALTGQSPFGKGSGVALIARTMSDPAKDPRELNATLHPDLCAFLMRCLKTNAAERYSSPEEFLEALHALRQKLCRPTLRPNTPLAPLIQSAETQRKVSFKEGDSIGQCDIERVVGTGAFGTVFKARHRLLDIPVAIKFLPVELATQSQDYIDMFLREARSAIRIRHKHVIGLYEAGKQDGQYYLIMEFAPNGSLHEKMDAHVGVLPVRETIRILTETAMGLAAAEESNIIHRDIKPANLMFGAQNEVKIADLGLAKRMMQKDMDGNVPPSVMADQLTLLRGETAAWGTPDYMAPESVSAPDQVNIRADLYALGVVAYQMLSGDLPFKADSRIQLIMKHVTDPVPPLKSDAAPIDPKLEKIVMRLLEKNPANRFQHPADLIAALAAI